MVYGVCIVWSLLGNAEDGCWLTVCWQEMFACHQNDVMWMAALLLFNVVSLEGEKWPMLWGFWMVFAGSKIIHL